MESIVSVLSRRSILKLIPGLAVKTNVKSLPITPENLVKFKLNKWILTVETAKNGFYYLDPSEFRIFVLEDDGITWRICFKEHQLVYRKEEPWSQKWIFVFEDYSMQTNNKIQSLKVADCNIRVIQ